MRHLLGLTLAAALLTGCSVKLPVEGHTPRTDFGKATGADGWEQAFWQALVKKDYAGMERHISSNYIFSDAHGKLDKQHALELFQRTRLDRFEMTDVQVLPQGNDFVVSYTMHLQGSVDGQPMTPEARRVVSVWQVQKRGGALVTQGVWPL